MGAGVWGKLPAQAFLSWGGPVGRESTEVGMGPAKGRKSARVDREGELGQHRGLPPAGVQVKQWVLTAQKGPGLPELWRQSLAFPPARSPHGDLSSRDELGQPPARSHRQTSLLGERPQDTVCPSPVTARALGVNLQSPHVVGRE